MRAISNDDGTLKVTFFKKELAQLKAARVIGNTLAQMSQDEGEPMMKAIDAILAKWGDEA